MARALHDAFAYVLDHYVAARTSERIGKSSSTWQRLMSIPPTLAATSVVRAHPRIQVRASAGQGGWARIPWVALLHADATSTTRDGIYVIFLFREDMSGVYLTLNQGVTEPIRRLGVLAGTDHVRQRAAVLREKVVSLEMAGFERRVAIDLRSEQPAAKQYAASTIAHKLYTRAEMPDEASTVEDLKVVLAAYAGLLASLRREDAPV